MTIGYQKVMELVNEGKSVEEIMKITNLNRLTIHHYRFYIKRGYKKAQNYVNEALERKKHTYGALKRVISSYSKQLEIPEEDLIKDLYPFFVQRTRNKERAKEILDYNIARGINQIESIISKETH